MFRRLSILQITLKLKYGIDSIINVVKRYVRGVTNETGMFPVYIDMT